MTELRHWFSTSTLAWNSSASSRFLFLQNFLTAVTSRCPPWKICCVVVLKNMDGENAGVGHPDWWKRGSKASGMNAAAINVVSAEMAKALHKTSMTLAAIQI